MNRISRRSAAETAEALLEAGRTQPALHYDVEAGLARHQHWVRSDAPMPEWASAGAGTAAKSLVPVAIKSIVSAVLVGALAAAAWHARGRPQPSAAEVKPPVPAVSAPSAPDKRASEARMRLTPMPVSRPGLPSDRPARRTVPDDVPGEPTTTRRQRAHTQWASAHADRSRVEPAVPHERPVPSVHAPPPRPEPATVRATTAHLSEEEVGPDRAPGPQAAAAPESKPTRATQSARPEPRPQPQVQEQPPDDLAEMQQVATAEQLLGRSPGRALALVRQGDRRFPRGYFQQERAYIAIMALIRLGRIEEARDGAASFAKHFPALPYGARIRSALEAQEAAP